MDADGIATVEMQVQLYADDGAARRRQDGGARGDRGGHDQRGGRRGAQR
jgi:hypothetical protein